MGVEIAAFPLSNHCWGGVKNNMYANCSYSERDMNDDDVNFKFQPLPKMQGVLKFLSHIVQPY